MKKILICCLILTIIIQGFAQINNNDIVIVEPEDLTIVQSENSVFINRRNVNQILVSNNTNNENGNLRKVSSFLSNNGGLTWDGILYLYNSHADPSVCISGLTGRYFVNFMNENYGIDIAYSDDYGSNWQYVNIASTQSMQAAKLDKNHLWIDNAEYRTDGSYNSNYGKLYAGWMRRDNLSGDGNGEQCGHLTPDHRQIFISRSVTNGESWETPVNISHATDVCQNQSVNIKTGPNGEVYACWVMTEPNTLNEVIIGFNKSFDGGVTWQPQSSRIQNITGHGHVLLGDNKIMRHNSFPSMAVNQQNGEIFIVWTNLGVPEGAVGDPDIYIIKSNDHGSTWSIPVRVNQDNTTNDQWFPWIACDDVSGALVVIYYDSRNDNTVAETFVSISFDNGGTWEDFIISDESWTPNGISGWGSYAGDYIGIDILKGFVVPVWSDDRNGTMLAYTQPFYIPCLPDLTLGNAIVNSAMAYNFRDNIIIPSGVNYLVTPSGNLELQANSEIIIEGEFEAQGEFFAHIVPCENGQKQLIYNNSESTNNKITVNKADFPANLINTAGIKIYPNPSKGKFTVICPENINSYNIDIFDIMGNNIFSENSCSGSKSVKLSDKQNGLYFIRITDSAGNAHTDKIIFQE